MLAHSRLLPQLLVLALWSWPTAAFFPWAPRTPCPVSSCHGSDTGLATKTTLIGEGNRTGGKRSAHAPRSFNLISSSNSRKRSRTTPTRVSRGLRSKYARRTAPQDLGKRENDFHIVNAVDPTEQHSAGIDQDGTDYTYLIEVELGSLAKSVRLLMDTGAGTTWVMSTNCTSTACAKHDSFGPSDSDTLAVSTDDFDVTYGSGKVSGVLGTDRIALAGLEVDMQFGLARETSDEFDNFAFDGILGLSLAAYKTDNFLTVLRASGQLGDAPHLFSVALSRTADAGPNRGQITLGALDHAKYTGNVTYTPLANLDGGDDDWAIPLDAMAVTFLNSSDGHGGTAPSAAGRTAFIDTGTSFMFGPKADVAELHAHIPGVTTSDNVTYTAPCDSTAEITVTFSGTSWTIPRQAWLTAEPAEDDKTGMCTSNVYAYEIVDGAWLMGATFIKNVYVVYDADGKRIGFAARATEGESRDEETGGGSDDADASSSLAQGGAATASPTTTGTASADASAAPRQTGAGAFSSVLVVVVLAAVVLVV